MKVKMPRVSLNIALDEQAQFGELSIATIGYGLQQAWVYATMIDAAKIFGTSMSITGSSDSALMLPFYASIIVFGLALVGAGVLDTKIRRIFFSRRCLFTFATFFAVGTALLLIPVQSPDALRVLHIVSGALSGLGTAYYLIEWGGVFSRLDVSSIVLNGALSIVIAFAIYVFVLQQLPFPAGAVIGIVIPYIELFILIHMHKGKDTLQQWESTADHYLPVQLGPFFVRFGVPVFLLGVVLGILRETSIEYVQPMSNFNLLTIVFLTACIATAFIVIMYITFGNNGKWNSLFKLLLPFVAIAVFCIPLAEHEALTWTMLLVITGYMLFEALMWIFFGQIAQQFNLSPVLTYGVGRGLLALASLLGTLIAMFDTYAAWELRSDMKMSFMLVILIVAFAILPERRDIMSIRKNAAKLQRIASERNDDFAPDVEDADEEPWAASAAPGCGVADAGAGVGAGVGAGAQGGEGVTGAPAVAATVTDDEGATGNVTACEKSARCAGAPEAAAGAAHTNAAGEVMLGQRLPATPGAAPEVMLGGAPSVGGAGVAGATGAPSATQTDAAGATASAEPAPKVYSIGATTSVIQPGASGPMAAVAEPAADAAHADEFDMARFRAQLDAVANTYLLSRREADVLLYLARGYKAAYIQEKLYIAEGTAKTHIRHIYRKLNVHSQQELMRLVDTTEI